ncbi:hypothetical protein ACP4OV_009115 [Aristida adscensionis]
MADLAARHGRDGRDLPEKEAAAPWLVGNTNPRGDKGKGKADQIPGSLRSKIPAREFVEIVLEKHMLVKDEGVNEANRDLVKHLIEMKKMPYFNL